MGSPQNAAAMQMRPPMVPLRPAYGPAARGGRGSSRSGSSSGSGSGSSSWSSSYSSSVPRGRGRGARGAARGAGGPAAKNIAIIRRDDPNLGPYRPPCGQSGGRLPTSTETKPAGAPQSMPGMPPAPMPYSPYAGFPPPPMPGPQPMPYAPFPPPQMNTPMIPSMPPYPSPMASQMPTTLMPLAQPPTAATPIVIPASVFGALTKKPSAKPRDANAILVPAEEEERKVITLPGADAPTLVQPEPDGRIVHGNTGQRSAHQVYMSCEHPYDPSSIAPLMPSTVPQHVRDQINGILKQGLDPEGSVAAKVAHISFVTPPSAGDKEAIPEYCINFYK